MKNLFNILASALIIFIVSSCQPNICDDTKQTLLEREFIMSSHLQYKDGSNAKNIPIVLELQKRYCDGTIKGVYREEGETDITGRWESKEVYQYIFENTKDVVTIKFYFTVDGNGFEKGRTFSYNEIAGQYSRIFVKFDSSNL